MDDSHDADAMVSKEAFSLLSTTKIAAIGMDIRVYKHSQAQKWRLPSGEIVILFVLEQEHNVSLVELPVCILGLVLFMNTMI